MSARDHTQIEELMAAASLGGLDPADQQILDRARADHEPCEECRELETAFGEIAGRLAFSLDPAPVDMAMADRILAVGGRVAVIPDLGAAPLPEPPAVSEPDPNRYRGNRVRRRRWTVGLGVAAVLGLVVVATLSYLPDLGRVSTHAVAGQRFVHLASPHGSESDAQLAMAYTPGTSGVVFWGTNLPDPGAGNVYEVWMITGTTPVSGGCLPLTDGQVAKFLDVNLGAATAMAVTAESSACPSAPTTKVIFSATLTA